MGPSMVRPLLGPLRDGGSSYQGNILGGIAVWVLWMKGVLMRRVLVPTDFSEAAWRVTEEALSWVEATGGELLLLHVVPDIFLRWCDDLALSFIDQTRLETAYKELCEEGQRRFSIWLPSTAHERCRTFVTVGETADAILKVAQAEKVDVIMMRAPKRRWWRPLLAAGVTDTVMRNAPVPVVVWAGLQKPAGGWWPGVSRPDEQATPQEDAWRERRRARSERTPLLKSW
jgi:nucleotide-binding universal stress UspA family protein